MTCSLSWSVVAVACDDGLLLLITHHTMILVIIAVLITDTINTLARTTDTVVTVVGKHTTNDDTLQVFCVIKLLLLNSLITVELLSVAVGVSE